MLTRGAVKKIKISAYYSFVLFNGLSTFIDNLMPNLSLNKIIDTIQPIAEGTRLLYPFESKCNSVTGVQTCLLLILQSSMLTTMLW